MLPEDSSLGSELSELSLLLGDELSSLLDDELLSMDDDDKK